MGGDLMAESILGEGSCFTIHLPFVKAAGHDGQASAAAAEPLNAAA